MKRYQYSGVRWVSDEWDDLKPFDVLLSSEYISRFIKNYACLLKLADHEVDDTIEQADGSHISVCILIENFIGGHAWHPISLVNSDSFEPKNHCDCFTCGGKDVYENG